MAVELAGTLVGGAGGGVPAVLVETGSTTVVGCDCACGGGVTFGGCGGMDVGAEVGVGEGVGAQGWRCGGHFELTAWVTALLVILPKKQRKRAEESKLTLRAV